MVGVHAELSNNLLFLINLSRLPRKWSMVQCYCHFRTTDSPPAAGPGGTVGGGRMPLSLSLAFVRLPGNIQDILAQGVKGEFQILSSSS
jgi:hypothetical protein